MVSLPLGDTRGFAPAAPPGSYRIAWIGGSEILGVRPGHKSIIPGLVNDRIDSVDGKRTATDIYFLNAMRLGDELSALHRALASKPDLVVVSLNPVWVANDLAVQQWGYLDGLLARGSLWPPCGWPVAASLVSPGDVGWKGLSSLFGSIDDRLYWGTELTGEDRGPLVPRRGRGRHGAGAHGARKIGPAPAGGLLRPAPGASPGRTWRSSTSRCALLRLGVTSDRR